GGFFFKQWKKRFVLLTPEGSLLVCHNATSSPDQLVSLQSDCEAIAEGKDILDLPKLPPGGSRSCCFALILHQNKYLLLLADNAADCSQWLNILKKVKQAIPCKRHQVPPNITLKDLRSEQIPDRDPLTPPISSTEASCPAAGTCGSPREGGANALRSQQYRGHAHSMGCLRHGTINNAQAMKAVYLLMGGAAASSALGYLGACSPSNLEAKAPDLPPNSDFAGIDPTGTYHSSSPGLDSPHFNTFDFEMAGSDFDAFDCGGFTF
ncbi:hypothetical protein NQD34_010701, partial [Periophthalmus magnuspinnatus]